MTTISAEQWRKMQPTKGKPKPAKQHQGSQPANAKALPEVRTTGTLDALKGYSPEKQSFLDLIAERVQYWDTKMNEIKTHDDWCFVMCQLREWRITEKRIKEL